MILLLKKSKCKENDLQGTAASREFQAQPPSGGCCQAWGCPAAEPGKCTQGWNGSTWDRARRLSFHSWDVGMQGFKDAVPTIAGILGYWGVYGSWALGVPCFQQLGSGDAGVVLSPPALC